MVTTVGNGSAALESVMLIGVDIRRISQSWSIHRRFAFEFLATPRRVESLST